MTKWVTATSKVDFSLVRVQTIQDYCHSTTVSQKVMPFFFSIIFTNPSTWAGYDTRSIFKWSLTGLNSEFSFS